MHGASIEGLDRPRSEPLPRLDVTNRLDRVGKLDLYATDVERHLLPALGAHLGEVLVNELNGRWYVPTDLAERAARVEPAPGEQVVWPVSHLTREEQARIGVVVGPVVVYPFEQAWRRLAADDPLDGSLTKAVPVRPALAGASARGHLRRAVIVAVAGRRGRVAVRAIGTRPGTGAGAGPDAGRRLSQ